MRVLLLSHTCQSRVEGQPRAEQLGRMPGVDLRVLVPDWWRENGSWRFAQVPETDAFAFDVSRIVWPWAGPAKWYMHWYRDLPRILKEFRPDIIDIWEEPWGLVSMHTCWLRNRLLPETKIVVETEQNINKKLPFPFEQFRSYTLCNADYAIGRNADAVEVLRHKGYTGPAAVVPNAVDPELFRPISRSLARKRLDYADDDFIVGYVGRLVSEKGVQDVVDALQYCPDNVRLLFVGSGPFRQMLEQHVRDLGREHQVKFLSSQPAKDLASIISAFNVLVLASQTTPSWKEQFGRVIIEANACRIPVIGSDSGAIPDVVGGAGLIVPERNPRALAQAICELRDNPEQCLAFGEAGYQQVREHYTWERVATRIRDVYNTLGLPAEDLKFVSGGSAEDLRIVSGADSA